MIKNKKRRKISIVVPIYNEELNIHALYGEIVKVWKKLKNYSYEIIFIDDGSIDNSWVKISEIVKRDKNIKGIRLSRNFGHACALEAGLRSVSADAAIIMDGDLQHPPSLIPFLVKEWEQGSEIVSACRMSTDGIGFFKKTTSRAFYLLLNFFSDLNLKNGDADFRLIDKKVLEVINKLSESPKFYRGIFSWVGFDQAFVEYKAPARKHGLSSYTLRKMLELARIGMTSFSMRPLKLIISIGAFIVIFSGLSLAIMLYLKLFIDYALINNNIILSTIILFAAGIVIISQGIIALYIIDIFNFSRSRPPFVIRKVIGNKKE